MNTKQKEFFSTKAKIYLQALQNSFNEEIINKIERLANTLLTAWVQGNQIFICGNGGSAANALHIANDLHYGIGACGPPPKLQGLRVEALPANTGIITCLANDTGYENIYSHQLEVKSKSGDILIALSGSGNSPNIVKALKIAKELSMQSIAIVAFSGGECMNHADTTIHFPINDMQIAEDTQLIVGHLCMQWLNSHKPNELKPLSNG